MATSYGNIGGTGDRRRYILVSVSSGYNSTSNAYRLIDGVTNGTGFFFSGSAASGMFMRWDFGTDQMVINEIKFYQSSTDSHGTWKAQGSNDGSSWTDIGSSFTLGGSGTQTITTLSGNSTAYKQYQLLGVSGTTSSSPWLYEFEFKIENSGNRTNGCAYANAGGIGDRTASITVATGGSMPTGGTLSQVVGGTYAATNPYINNTTSSGNFLRFDFGGSKLIDECALWYSGGSYGTWKWQGSPDASSWTDIGSSFTLAPDATSPANLTAGRQLNGNSTAYRYYRILCTSGASFTSDGNLLEFEFRITTGASSFKAAFAVSANQLIGS